VSYWNKASFKSEKGRFEVVWLESAVIIKSESQWKVQMLRSTKIAKDKVPDLKYKEYIE